METVELVLDTSGGSISDLTAELRRFCRGRRDGLVNAFCPHATAALVLMETGAGSDLDLLDWLQDHLPRDDHYRHRHGSAGHGADHLLPALLGSSVTVPVVAGEPLLGAWQSLLLVDTNSDNNRRRLRLSFLPAA